MTAVAMDTRINDIIFRLLGRIAPEADFETLDPYEDLREALDIDSFDFLNFLIGLNEIFGVEIPEADYGQLVTLADINHYLDERIN